MAGARLGFTSSPGEYFQHVPGANGVASSSGSGGGRGGGTAAAAAAFTAGLPPASTMIPLAAAGRLPSLHGSIHTGLNEVESRFGSTLGTAPGAAAGLSERSSYQPWQQQQQHLQDQQGQQQQQSLLAGELVVPSPLPVMSSPAAAVGGLGIPFAPQVTAFGEQVHSGGMPGMGHTGVSGGLVHIGSAPVLYPQSSLGFDFAFEDSGPPGEEQLGSPPLRKPHHERQVSLEGNQQTHRVTRASYPGDSVTRGVGSEALGQGGSMSLGEVLARDSLIGKSVTGPYQGELGPSSWGEQVVGEEIADPTLLPQWPHGQGGVSVQQDQRQQHQQQQQEGRMDRQDVPLKGNWEEFENNQQHQQQHRPATAEEQAQTPGISPRSFCPTANAPTFSKQPGDAAAAAGPLGGITGTAAAAAASASAAQVDAFWFPAQAAAATSGPRRGTSSHPASPAAAGEGGQSPGRPPAWGDVSGPRWAGLSDVPQVSAYPHQQQQQQWQREQTEQEQQQQAPQRDEGFAGLPMGAGRVRQLPAAAPDQQQQGQQEGKDMGYGVFDKAPDESGGPQGVYGEHEAMDDTEMEEEGVEAGGRAVRGSSSSGGRLERERVGRREEGAHEAVETAAAGVDVDDDDVYMRRPTEAAGAETPPPPPAAATAEDRGHFNSAAAAADGGGGGGRGASGVTAADGGGGGGGSVLEYAPSWDDTGMSSESDPLKALMGGWNSGRYCCNCTAPLQQHADTCSSCGHAAHLDDKLMNGWLMGQEAPGRTTRVRGRGGRGKRRDECRGWQGGERGGDGLQKRGYGQGGERGRSTRVRGKGSWGRRGRGSVGVGRAGRGEGRCAGKLAGSGRKGMEEHQSEEDGGKRGRDERGSVAGGSRGAARGAGTGAGGKLGMSLVEWKCLRTYSSFPNQLKYLLIHRSACYGQKS